MSQVNSQGPCLEASCKNKTTSCFFFVFSSPCQESLHASYHHVGRLPISKHGWSTLSLSSHGISCDRQCGLILIQLTDMSSGCCVPLLVDYMTHMAIRGLHMVILSNIVDYHNPFCESQLTRQYKGTTDWWFWTLLIYRLFMIVW